MESEYREVEFYIFCPKCEHEDLEEKFDPCNECLEYGMREGTRKPLHYKPKKEE